MLLRSDWLFADGPSAKSASRRKFAGRRSLRGGRCRRIHSSPETFEGMLEAFNGILTRFGISDVVQVSLGLALHALGQVVQHVDGLVNPVALLERS